MSKKKSRRCQKQRASMYRVVLLIRDDYFFKNMTYEQARYCFELWGKTWPCVLCTVDREHTLNAQIGIPISPDMDKQALDMRERLDGLLRAHYGLGYDDWENATCTLPMKNGPDVTFNPFVKYDIVS